MALCLFGGAFNPPHRTHERAIRTALAQLPIAGVVVIPSGQHPLKSAEDMAPAEDRVALARLAFESIEGVTVDDWETRQSGRSYTVETLLHFREYADVAERPYWILGSDNIRILPSWHRYREFLELAIPVTCPRVGYPVDAGSLAALGLDDRQQDEILEHVLQMPADDVSASEIRECLRRGASAAHWLTPTVEARIVALGLYGAGERG